MKLLQRINNILDDKVRSFVIAFLLLLAVGTIGVHGFILLEGFLFVEAFFLTIVTKATIGFREVQPLSPPGQFFTSFLIIVSFGINAYVVTTLT